MRKCLPLFLLALLAKSSAATLPLVLVVIDLYMGRRPVRRVLVEKAPFVLLSIVFGVTAVYARGGASHLQDFALRYSLVERVCIVSFSCLWYVGKLLWPLYKMTDHTDGKLAFDFETYVEAGKEDPDVNVMVIDYAEIEKNPKLVIRKIRDELVDAAKVDDNTVNLTVKQTLEIDGVDKPAAVAEMIVRIIF